jgi:hypothetical protein
VKKPVSQRNPVIVIQNFYMLITIVIMAVVMVLYTQYIVPKTNPKNEVLTQTLPCFETQKTIIKIVDEEKIKKAYKLLKKGSFELRGGFITPLQGVSKLESHYSIEVINKLFLDSINIKPNNTQEQYVRIVYEIIEESNKPLVIQSSFRISANEVFRGYTQSESLEEKKIQQRIECLINSFKINAK